MAITRAEVQIVWAAANSISVAAGAAQVSDAFVFTDATIQAAISLKADNNGVPAAGDKVKCYLLLTSGDPDGAVADEYDSANHGLFLGELDTASDDPAQMTVDIPSSAKGGKVRAVSAAATNGITVSATIYETRG